MSSANITRRGLLKSAAAGAIVLPSIVPSTVFGESAPSNRIGMAQLGCGGRGSAVSGGFVRHKDVQYLAVCDPFKSRRDRLADRFNKKYGGGKTVKPYADFREVLKRDDIDAVAICTQDHWHVPMAMAASKAGKDM